jgi:quercetin dioxygenase-like cupin family protein
MTTAKAGADWPDDVKQDFERNACNGCVGDTLLSETDKVRVWKITLKPGERIGFHRHVLDYFWTAVTGGRARSHLDDGTTYEVSHYPGETKHLHFGKGEYRLHDLENIGDTDLIFTTVEFLDSTNEPLPIPNAHKLKAAA